MGLAIAELREPAGPAAAAKRTSKYTLTGFGDTVTGREDSGKPRGPPNVAPTVGAGMTGPPGGSSRMLNRGSKRLGKYG